MDDSELSDDLLDEDDELGKAQLILPLRDKKGVVGGTVKFACRAQSISNETDVQWFVNDVLTTSGVRVKISVEDDGELFILNIKDLRVSDSGSYKCVFKTPDGSLDTSAHLDVEGMTLFILLLCTCNFIFLSVVVLMKLLCL